MGGRARAAARAGRLPLARYRHRRARLFRLRAHARAHVRLLRRAALFRPPHRSAAKAARGAHPRSLRHRDRRVGRRGCLSLPAHGARRAHVGGDGHARKLRSALVDPRQRLDALRPLAAAPGRLRRAGHGRIRRPPGRDQRPAAARGSSPAPAERREQCRRHGGGAGHVAGGFSRAAAPCATARHAGRKPARRRSRRTRGRICPALGADRRRARAVCCHPRQHGDGCRHVRHAVSAHARLLRHRHDPRRARPRDGRRPRPHAPPRNPAPDRARRVGRPPAPRRRTGRRVLPRGAARAAGAGARCRRRHGRRALARIQPHLSVRDAPGRDARRQLPRVRQRGHVHAPVVSRHAHRAALRRAAPSRRPQRAAPAGSGSGAGAGRTHAAQGSRSRRRRGVLLVPAARPRRARHARTRGAHRPRQALAGARARALRQAAAPLGVESRALCRLPVCLLPAIRAQGQAPPPGGVQPAGDRHVLPLCPAAHGAGRDGRRRLRRRDGRAARRVYRPLDTALHSRRAQRFSGEIRALHLPLPPSVPAGAAGRGRHGARAARGRFRTAGF